MAAAGRVLGVDLGDVRVGLAVSDPAGVVATPLETLQVADRDDAAVAATVAGVAAREGAATVVVGLPRTLAGREHAPAQRARRFARLLHDTAGLEVRLWDERFTSAEAERAMLAQGATRRERRAAADRVAATLLLQAYLDATRSRGGPPGS